MPTPDPNHKPTASRAHSRRRRRVAPLTAAIAIVLATVPAAGDAPSAKMKKDTSLLGTPRPDLTEGLTGETLTQVTGNVQRAKIQFVFPPVSIRGNFNLCVSDFSQDNPYSQGDPVIDQQCREVLNRSVAPSVRDSNIGQLGGYLEAYVVRRVGSKLEYGTFPPVEVRALAFGSIPATATVQLTQASSDGFIEPLIGRLGAVSSINAFFAPAGTRLYPDLPPVPPYTQGPFGPYTQTLDYRNQIDGRLNVAVTKLTVDGEPVAIGNNCKTAYPSTLKARAAIGYYPEATPNQPPRGTPGGFQPNNDYGFYPPGIFDGTIDIPAFSNCGAGGDDLDPLLTALVSGPSNHVSGFLPKAVSQAYFCQQVSFANCPSIASTQARRLSALASEAARHHDPATVRKLQRARSALNKPMPKIRAASR